MILSCCLSWALNHTSAYPLRYWSLHLAWECRLCCTSQAPISEVVAHLGLTTDQRDGLCSGHVQRRAGDTQAAQWGQGHGGTGLTAFGHYRHGGGVCNQTERLWHLCSLHKAVQASTARYDPGKPAPSHEHHIGGKQWDLPPSSATGSSDALSWPVLYWYS